MTYIKREIQIELLAELSSPERHGVILAGMVGTGKTTLAQQCLGDMRAAGWKVFEFTGDDTVFRAKVATDSRLILNEVRSATQGPAIVFVDEVQKSEDVFDAIKVAFDEGHISFIVSGSNPHYLDTVAKQRLQRRAQFRKLSPLSLGELIGAQGSIDLVAATQAFRTVLFEAKLCEVPDLGVTFSSDISSLIDRYLRRGGFPLAQKAKSEAKALSEVRKVVERGFETMLRDAQNVSDIIKVELARIHSREFAYDGMFKRTGLRSRDRVNAVIDELKGHGYLVGKHPIFPGEHRRSYLTVYSYTDPGVVTYLSGQMPEGEGVGHRIEGMVHARLAQILSDFHLRTELAYFKPYNIDINGKTKFLPGEIDFLVQVGDRLVPIEVKATADLKSIQTPVLDDFVAKHKLPYGVVLYGGVPFAEPRRKRIYWPYWLV